MKKILQSQWIATTLFLVLAVVTLFSLTSQFRSVPIVPVGATSGTADLTGFDFERNSANVVDAEFYPGMLLLPSEIDGYAPVYSFDPSADCHTIRARLLVPDGIYLIYTTSPDYASRFYINGGEAEQYGYVDLSGAGNHSYRTAPMNIAAAPVGGTIEVVIHTAGKFHDNVTYRGFVLGAFETVKNEPIYHIVNRLLPTVLTLAFALFYFGHFLFTPSNKENLWFALITFSTALLLTPADALFPRMSYEFEYRAVRLSITLICVFYSLFVRELYGIPKKIPLLVCGISAAAAVLLCALPLSTIAGNMMVHNVFVFAVMVVCLVSIVLKIRQYNTEQYISLAGQVVFMMSGVLDSLGIRNVFGIPLMSFFGITVFLFAQMLALYLVSNRAVRNEQRVIAENVALESLNKTKTELLVNISHECKTPLTVISNVLQLSERHTKDGYIREKMDIAVSEVERMKERLGGLLRVVRLEDAQMQWDMRAVSIRELISATVSTYFHTLDEHNNTLKLDIPEDLPDVTADPIYLQSVIINLIENAVRFTHSGEIAVRASAGGGFVTVSVQDTGCGMTAEQMGYAFERFRRGENSTGSGLGLYICKKTLDAHGGEIYLESEQGMGTTVTFTVPIFGN